MAEQSTDQKAGYRGRWKKWLLIYLAIGAVAYAIIYFVFLHHSGGGSGGGGGGYFLLAPPMGLLMRRGRR
jgi:hypothetical protein